MGKTHAFCAGLSLVHSICSMCFFFTAELKEWNPNQPTTTRKRFKWFSFFRSFISFVRIRIFFIKEKYPFKIDVSAVVAAPSSCSGFFYYFIMLLQNIYTRAEKALLHVFFVFFFIIQCLCLANYTRTHIWLKSVFVLLDGDYIVLEWKEENTRSKSSSEQHSR